MNPSFRYELLKKDKRSNARIGRIHTPHGILETPAFVPVGTQASVKSVSPEELIAAGTQLYFVNTYHMYLRPGIDTVNALGGLHDFMHWNKPLITDSGGFQVFSLARSKHPAPHESDVKSDTAAPGQSSSGASRNLVKISENGVEFQSHWDGSKHTFTPELSMQYQWALGSDIHIAFDDCTPYPVTREDARLSMERTHRWAIRSADEHRKLAADRNAQMPYQALYGSIQGSVYEDLRMTSSDFISGLDIDGYAVGGVSVGESKQDMVAVIGWVLPRLRAELPRHLLGVGEIDDMFALIEAGFDTFDCVQPSRLARMGWLSIRGNDESSNTGHTLDITKSVFAADPKPVDAMCACYTCQNYSRAYLHHLFHVRELLGYRLATIHNLSFMHALVAEIRKSIGDGSFLDLKAQWL